MRLILSLVAFLVVASSADAQVFRRRAAQFATNHPVLAAPAVAVAGAVRGTVDAIQGSLAQAKANQQAAEGRMRHVGGGFDGGTAEGVGFSTASADRAIRNCCYFGVKTPIQIATSYGYNAQFRMHGWFATVIYR